ncbi:hypothetical protein [Lysinibacillus piscis]|uniref:Uncharacterized protein n=1 Tax=Lysinibacillus piscis TaxID=2518931 RepID=A0ABQ5NL68_9BACI|nr:hypothetical protein [Lysinibacillus sp. KH24]GLC89101.1 hypothetical protein LYSBPC_22280 [Lysinibacillus sp. KH24]
MLLINLMQAYELNKLSTLGYTEEEILKALRKGDVSSWQEKAGEDDFAEIQALFQESEQSFLDAYNGHYRIKYVTLPGLRNLLRLRFGLEEGKNFQVLDTGVQHVTCDEETAQQIQQMLSTNWSFVKQADGTYSITVG